MSDDPNAIAQRHALIAANEAVVDEYVKSYEAVTEDAHGREGVYQPTEGDRHLIQDAIAGLLADDDFVRTFNAWQDAVRASGHAALKAAAEEFVAKVERGEARSTRSYAAFKAALALLPK